MKNFRSFFRSLFIRRTADHKQAPGFAVYVLAAIAVIVVAGIGVRHVNRPAARVTPAGVVAKTNRAKVETDRLARETGNFVAPPALKPPPNNPLAAQTQPLMAQSAGTPAADDQVLDTVRIAAEGGGLARRSAPGGPAAAVTSPSLPDGFIDEGDRGIQVRHSGSVANPANASNLPAGTEVLGEQGAPNEGPLRVGQPLQIQSSSAVNPDTLTIYAGDKVVAQNRSKASAPSGFDVGDFLPLGTEIPVVFDSKIDTLDLEGLVRLIVVADVRSPNGRLQIPSGTLVYGTAAKKNVTTRVAINARTLVYLRDGRQVPLDGIIKDEDGQPGVRGYYIPPPPTANVISYVTPALVGFLQSQQQLVQTTALTAAGALQTAPVANPYSLRNETLNAAQSAIQDQLHKKQAELDNLYQGYVEVRAGTIATLQLQHALDLDQKDKDQAPPEKTLVAQATNPLGNALTNALKSPPTASTAP